MELTIGAWYNEPETRLEFSYRILEFIRKALVDCIMTPLGLTGKYPEKTLHLKITTSFAQDQLAVRMSPFRENSTTVNCKLLFPYKAIRNAEKPVEAYVEYFIQSIPLIFERWEVKPQQVHAAAVMIRSEIIGNPSYALTAEEKSARDAANTAATKILKLPDPNKSSGFKSILARAANNWFSKFFSKK